MSASRSWAYRHPYISTGIRVAAGTWNLLLGINLLARGYPWGAALFVVAALIFGPAYFLLRARLGSSRS